MSTPIPPEGNEPSPMLGMKPLQDAAGKLERAADVIKDSQSKLNSQLADLNKTLGKLASSLGGKGGKSGTAGTSGHSYGKSGGDATFSGQPHGSQQGQGGQPAKTPNGGGGLFSGLSFNKTPAPTAPGGAGRFAAAFMGATPKAWGTQYNSVELAGQLTHQGIDILAQRGQNEVPDAALLQRLAIEARQRGAKFSQGESNIIGGVFGTTTRSPQNFTQTGQIGQGAIASMQSTLDGYRAVDTAQSLSGGVGSERGARRFNALMGGSNLLGYSNPTASLEQTTKVMGQMVQPSQRMRMMMMGLPDPTDSTGQYKGNAQFFAAFLKRMYNKDSVPPDVFEDDFRVGGLGWANLTNVVGEEAAQLMLTGLRGYNYGKAMGKDTSDFDQVFDQANRVGSAGDQARKTAKEKYNVGDPYDTIQQEQRANVTSRASELAGHGDFNRANYASNEAMHIFADAVHKFVNAPIISDIGNFLKAVGPAIGQLTDTTSAGAMNLLGISGRASQGPITDARGGGGAPITSGSAVTPPAEKPKKDDSDVLNSLVKKATSYATGSRKYKYSMPLRNKDGYFDCSSFVSRVYAQYGYKIGPTTVQMWRQGSPVDLDDVQPGDLLLWARGKPGAQSGAAEHVEMYIGNGKTVGTARARKGQNTIQIQPFRKGDWDAARRIIGSAKAGKPKKDVSDPNTGGSGDFNADGTTRTNNFGGSDFSGGARAAVGTAGTGGTGSAGLGSPNAAAYGSNELSALMGILTPGGGGGGGTSAGSAGSEEPGTESEEKPPQDAKHTAQDPGDSAEDKRLGKRPTNKDVKAGKIRLDPNGRTKNYAPEKHPNPNPGSNKSIARAMLSSMGWDKHWGALEKLWTRESGWNQYADNKSSDAYGIPQSLPGTKMSSAGSDWRTNPATQIKWGLNYIKGRYGTPTRAWAHSQATGWYDTGAWQVPDDQVAVVHKDEMILPKQQAQTIRDALIKENLGGAVTGNSASSISQNQGTVQLNFQPGAIVLKFGKDVSPEAGKGAARGFIKELENHQLFQKIASGRRNSERDRRIS